MEREQPATTLDGDGRCAWPRIIVGYDGSPGSRAAVEWAAAEALLHGSRLVAWTVLDKRGTLDANPPPKVAGVPVERHGVYGHPATALVRACTDADLLVLGSRGNAPAGSPFRGSVVSGCLHSAPCPVVVVPPDFRSTDGHRRVIVGLDCSPHAREALLIAAEEAHRRGAALHALHAVHWDHDGTALMRPSTHDLIGWGRDLVERELARAGVQAHAIVVEGHPAEVLVRRSDNADLMVLGSRGHSPLGSVLVGSTSAHCAYHSRCPVMLVRADRPR